MRDRDQHILTEARRRLLATPLLGRCSILPDGDGPVPRAAALFPEGCAGEIEVAVHHGVLRLQGEVEDPQDGCLAGEVVRDITGCRRVMNLLMTRTRASKAPRRFP